MNLSGLIPLIRTLPTYRETLALISGHDSDEGHVTALALPRSARPAVLAAMIEDLKRPHLVLTAHIDRARVLQQETLAWNPECQLKLFAEPNVFHYHRAPRGLRPICQRLETLAMFSRRNVGAGSGAVSSARALMMPTLPQPEFHAHSQSLRTGERVRLQKLVSDCTYTGYALRTMVSAPGECSRRGGIVDIWPPTDKLPTRIELFGDEIESMRRFDPSTQRSCEEVEAVHLPPAREVLPGAGPDAAHALAQGWPESDPEDALAEHRADFERLASGVIFPELEYYLPWLHPEGGTLLDYLPKRCLIIIENWQTFVSEVHEFEQRGLQLRDEQVGAHTLPADAPAASTSWSELQDQLSTRPLLLLAGADHEPDCDLGADFAPSRRHGGQIKSLLDYLEKLVLREKNTVVVSRQAVRIAELWNAHTYASSDVVTESTVKTDDVSTIFSAGSTPVFVQGALAEGFTVARSSLHLLSDAELFGWRRPEPRRPDARLAVNTPEESFTEFTSGKLVVHSEHGIGRFLGLVSRAIDKVEREYLRIEYGSGDSLYVPITQTDRLSLYVGPDAKIPTLSRLGATEWARARERTRAAVEEVAKELLSLYAQRETSVGHAFPPDTSWQAELESSFPYVETEDQQKALADVKRDMLRPRPMDRLICGDVGYGKTEVALRAAFKAVLDGKQVALLVPTTVLAQQHFLTFQQRLAAFPVCVEMLSRFRTRNQQHSILAALEAGEVDIIIGTHRLLQSDVQFKDLGLLIVDEEQRFGVTHKEHLKKIRASVDILTLTATPIPRTLYMSLTGTRDISTINTAPEARLPVVTRVAAHSKPLLRKAVRRELDRNGQVYYVHNRVHSINAAAKRLAAIVPEARVVTAHGQMPEKHLEAAMAAFVSREYDVLVCTSIIESGLDIPNANTLIVDGADMFGLAQLYQLRGRVGRGANQGYAYLLYSKRSRRRITAEAYARLQTIAEQTDLGAGYGIAMRDLEMRGAGDILGKRQHGHIAAVGFHLYTRLLRKAVQSHKANSDGNSHTLRPDWDISLVSVELPLEAALPASYIADRALRMRLYRRLADLENEHAVNEMLTELSDRFGPVPAPVHNLLFQLRVKLRAHRANIEAVGSEGKMISLRCPLWEKDGLRAKLIAILPNDTRITNGKVWLSTNGSAEEWQQRLLKSLDALAENRSLIESD